VVPVRELSVNADKVADTYKAGDMLDLVVIARIGSDKEGGSYLLSQRRLEARRVWNEIEDKFKASETIKAPVTQVVKGGIVVDAEGELSVNADKVADTYKAGDMLDLVVIARIGSDKEGGSYLLSQRRLEARRVWNEIEDKFKAGETIKAPVTQVVKGGLVVDAGVRGFVPASMVSDHFVEDLNQFKGQELELKIVEIEP